MTTANRSRTDARSARLVTPVCASTRFLSHTALRDANTKAAASRTSPATAPISANVPTGLLYASSGRAPEGPAGETDCPGTVIVSTPRPAPGTEAVIESRSPGRAAVTYETRQVRLSSSSMAR